jgi:hypothetical protein
MIAQGSSPKNENRCNSMRSDCASVLRAVLLHIGYCCPQIALERRRPISENLHNLREAFLLPGFSQVNIQWSKVNHHGAFSSGAGTRPAS